MGRKNHWRWNGRPARFWIFDARAGLSLLIVFLHWSMWTLKLGLTAFAIFGAMEKLGFSVDVFGRWLRSRIAGPIRQSTPWWRRPRN
jgi:intracellular multiplication protein IcmT